MAAAATLSAGAREALRADRRARVVRHARLLPALPDDAGQMRFALEDALNTADFGDCGRLVVVRRLRVRGLPRLAGGTVVALALEEAWRALAPSAVSHRHTQATQADAVYFASRAEARLAWLEVVAEGQPAEAWFWRAALPELASAPAHSYAEGGIAAVMAALLEESAAQTIEVLHSWPDERLIGLAKRLPATSGECLLQVLTVDGQALSPAAEDQSDPAPEPAQAADARPGLALLARLRRDDSHSAPTPWLAALWMSAAKRTAPTRAEVAALLARATQHRTEGATTRPSEPHTLDPARDHPISAAPPGQALMSASEVVAAGDADTTFAEAAQTPSRSVAGTAARQGTVQMPSDLPPARHRGRQAEPTRNRSALPWLDNSFPTTHGGLLLAVNLLHELQFASWLQSLPHTQRQPFANALLAHVLHTLDCAPDEPQLAWFENMPPAARAAVPGATLPTAASHSASLRAWTLRLRRFLRRHTGMDLDALVRRPAWVSATPTHADAIFALDQTDLRLRRLGLDRDPGWVPWLGRIVSFHFLARELLPPDRSPHVLAQHG